MARWISLELRKFLVRRSALLDEYRGFDLGQSLTAVTAAVERRRYRPRLRHPRSRMTFCARPRRNPSTTPCMEKTIARRRAAGVAMAGPTSARGRPIWELDGQGRCRQRRHGRRRRSIAADSYVTSDEAQVSAAAGSKNMVVVATEDAMLVAQASTASNSMQAFW